MHISITTPVRLYLAVYIGTSASTLGNPRRGWYLSRLDGEPLFIGPDEGPVYRAWVEEGVEGTGSLWSAISRLLGTPYKIPGSPNVDWPTSRRSRCGAGPKSTVSGSPWAVCSGWSTGGNSAC